MDGRLHTIDNNEELRDIQRKYFVESGFGEQIVQYTGDAKTIIPTLDVVFDLVFIDAEKREYPEYFEMALLKTRPGSIILSDNVLWSGKIVEPVGTKDKDNPNSVGLQSQAEGRPSGRDSTASHQGRSYTDPCEVDVN